MRFLDQGQFHPALYLAALAEAILRLGGTIHTRTHVVEVEEGERPDECRVHSVIRLHRSRIDNQARDLVAGRTDCWRCVEGQWLLARRDIELDHSTVPDTNLNVFF